MALTYFKWEVELILRWMDWQSYGFRKVISARFTKVHRATPLRQLDITISGWIPSSIKAEPGKAVHQVTICLCNRIPKSYHLGGRNHQKIWLV